ncbi:hypothetical protein QHI69_19770 [Burkholderia gladioli pv. gladioli]|uniref:Uncharacterized protein n=1 Tax=Burkholderia gladioli TaxID=28095 RepID=A0AAW3ETH4_BURGA|nr:hypothetical protein [Burkholderia gladioli]AJX00620.1 hypothetical protein BM43_4009 [Burkholderia gladioli]KGC11370.1 hypothetical protein DM48_7489 [Burkholderia gladioli]MDJ1164124.1 hypothetical protein [Burkholderia gladioli pv. gladioli]QPQ84258.1 hypothetical protein I6H08_04125 [Burkholderia gladioli]
MKTIRLQFDASGSSTPHAEIVSLIENALAGLDCRVEPASGTASQRTASRSRLRLPRDQKVYLSLARFIEESPTLGEQLFALDAHRGIARINLIDAASDTVLQSRTYPYTDSTEATLDTDILVLQLRIAADFGVAASR